MEEKLDLVLSKAKKAISLEGIYSRVESLLSEEAGNSIRLSSEQKQEIQAFLVQKVGEYEVYETPNGNYFPLYKTSFRKGRFFANRNGQGNVFVTVDYMKDGHHIVKEDCYFIDRDHIHQAIDGDIVLIENLGRDKKGNLNGTVNKVISRDLNMIVGEIYRIGSQYFLKPLDKRKQGLMVAIQGEAIEGQRVAVCLEQQMNDGFYLGTISRVFNHKDDPEEDILFEAFQLGIDDQFSEESMRQVREIPQSVRPVDKIGRMDLTSWDLFTIDDVTAKDLDDALSCQKLDNGNFLIGVHIADVSNYVPLSSPLERDAFRKGTSTYLGGKVIPMLPHELSNGICSLNPDVDRLALSCVMEVTPKGKVVHSDIWQSVIHSRLKMTYDKVSDLLERNVVLSEYAPYEASLRSLNQLAQVLRKNRLSCGSIEFCVPELKLNFSSDGKMDGISIREQNQATELVEEFMLLANETVAKHLNCIDVPCLYRVHDVPNQEKMEEFLQLLQNIGCDVSNYDASECCNSHQSLQRLVKYVSDMGMLSSVLSQKLIRCMSKAKYSDVNIGHHGLAKEDYCHFTSPIRRYPDLTIHRILKDCYFNEGNSHKRKHQWESRLPEIGLQSSKMERAADEAENRVLYMKCAEYMMNYIGEHFHGTVIGVGSKGLQIQLDNYIEGRVRMKDLVGEYIYHPESSSLLSLDGREDYYIGDRLDVCVAAADKGSKTIDFKVYEKLQEFCPVGMEDEHNCAKILAKSRTRYS